MLLEYADDAKLYVPLAPHGPGAEVPQPGAAPHPTLDRLGGTSWDGDQDARQEVDARTWPSELLKLYAERKVAEGYSFSPDSNWQREFEDAFEFERDPRPADRRRRRQTRHGERRSRWTGCSAATSATARPKSPCAPPSRPSMDGKQVAVLAPTTVLAFQHFETFKRRFAAFPGAHRDAVSRFRTPKEQKQAGRRSSRPARWTSSSAPTGCSRKDVEFQDLGLVIVDEEQRFGVTHKERLKQLQDRWTCSP